MDDTLERTLYVCTDVSVFKIPPRPDAGGFRSGEWLIADKILSGHLRLVSIGNSLEIRLEDSATGELFAVCPVVAGQREVCVESVIDSSRYFVLRVVDPVTSRHAFLGLGFEERGDAFDFSAAISDHERHTKRENEVKAATAAGTKVEDMPSELASLYKSRGDLGLKEGQTITVSVNVKKNKNAESAAKGGFMSRHADVGKVGLIPPPVSSGSLKSHALIPPPAAGAQPIRPPSNKIGSENSSGDNQGWATFD